jgi:hypothetical protein
MTVLVSTEMLYAVSIVMLTQHMANKEGRDQEDASCKSGFKRGKPIRGWRK